MDHLNHLMTQFVDGVMWPFRPLGPTVTLLIVSILVGVVMLWLFGKTTNQSLLRHLKTRIKGHLLEMWLFQDDLGVTMRAQGKTLWNTMKYAACSLTALVVLMIPVVLIMVQLQARYGWRPLQPGEDAVVTIAYAEPTPLEAMNATVEASDGLAIETPPLRMPGERTVNFRIGAFDRGLHELKITTPDQQFTKTVQVGGGAPIISPMRASAWWNQLLYPIENATPPGAIASVEVAYPTADVPLIGWNIHWIWIFLIVSIAAGFALKGIFGIEV